MARAIREGIGRDGRALFPMMPYKSFRQMSDEDVASVIVYLRSLRPVSRVLPKTEIPFPSTGWLTLCRQPSPNRCNNLICRLRRAEANTC